MKTVQPLIRVKVFLRDSVFDTLSLKTREWMTRLEILISCVAPIREFKNGTHLDATSQVFKNLSRSHISNPPRGTVYWNVNASSRDNRHVVWSLSTYTPRSRTLIQYRLSCNLFCPLEMLILFLLEEVKLGRLILSHVSFLLFLAWGKH